MNATQYRQEQILSHLAAKVRVITPAMRWYVAATLPMGEETAVQHLRNQGYSTWCPIQRIKAFVRHQYVPRDYPLLRGYVFVAFDVNDRTVHWPSINSTRGVLHLLIPHRERPTPLPVGLIEQWQSQIGAEGVMEVGEKETWRPKSGDPIKIKSGDFADITTFCELAQGERIQVVLDFLGGKRKTWLRLDQVEPHAKAL